MEEIKSAAFISFTGNGSTLQHQKEKKNPHMF